MPIAPQPRPWRTAYANGLLLTTVGCVYLGIRRSDFDLFIANKAIACAGLLCITIAIVAGRSARWMVARPHAVGLLLRAAPPREMGLVGVQLTVLHVVLTLAGAGAIGAEFPFPSWFIEHPVETLTGLVAFGMLMVVLKRTARGGSPRLGTPIIRWMVPLSIVHVLVLKMPGWRSWLASFEPWMAPWSLLVALLTIALTITAVFLGRLARRSPASTLSSDTSQTPR